MVQATLLLQGPMMAKAVETVRGLARAAGAEIELRAGEAIAEIERAIYPVLDVHADDHLVRIIVRRGLPRRVVVDVVPCRLLFDLCARRQVLLLLVVRHGRRVDDGTEIF